jgi:hypothetical protein
MLVWSRFLARCWVLLISHKPIVYFISCIACVYISINAVINISRSSLSILSYVDMVPLSFHRIHLCTYLLIGHVLCLLMLHTSSASIFKPVHCCVSLVCTHPYIIIMFLPTSVSFTLLFSLHLLSCWGKRGSNAGRIGVATSFCILLLLSPFAIPPSIYLSLSTFILIIV